MRIFLRKHQAVYKIGVEISSRNLRFIVIRQQKPVLSCEKFGVIEYGEDENVQNAWKELANQCQHYHSFLIVGIGISDALIKSYYLDKTLKEKERITYFSQQSQWLLKLSPTDISFDYVITHTPETEQLCFKMVAVRKQIITKLKNYANVVGLKVLAVDVTTLALGRIFPYLEKQAHSAKKYCVISILEKNYLLYCVYSDSEMIFSKQVDYGFEDSQLIEQDVEKIFDKISLAFMQAQQFYINQYHKPTPQILLLAGELAEACVFLMKTIVPFEVRLINFGENLEMNHLKQNSYLTFITSLGLALWE